MQIVGRLCDGCGEAVTKLGGADGCGSCDVVLCAKCTKGTERCPSCQRLFDETRDLPPRLEREADAALERGRRQAIAIAVTIVGAVLVTMALGAPITGGLMHLALAGLLLLQLFRGRGWARWILVGIAALTATGNAYQGLTHFGVGRWVPSLALALTYAFCAAVLVLSKPLDRYLRAQRLRHP